MKNWKKRHKMVLCAALLILFAGIPFLIHCLFKLETRYDFFAAEWTAGDFLQYYGALLTFCSTVILSLLALWQNETIRKESNKHTELLERMEIKNKMPLFDVGYLPKKTTIAVRMRRWKSEIYRKMLRWNCAFLTFV